MLRSLVGSEMCIRDRFQEVGVVAHRAQMKPRDGDAGLHKPQKRKPKDVKARTMAAPGTGVKRKAANTEKKVPKKKRTAKPTVVVGEKEHLSMHSKMQRVMHVLAIQPSTLTELKAHTLLKTIPAEELSRMTRRVSDMQQGRKFGLRKGCYRQLNPSYDLLPAEELAKVLHNIVSSGGISLSECVPLTEPDMMLLPTVPSRPSPPKPAAKPAPGLTVAQRKAAAALKQQVDRVNLAVGTKLGTEQSRAAEIADLKRRLAKHDGELRSAGDAARIRAEYNEKYPKYLSLNEMIEEHEATFKKLKSEYSTAANKRRKDAVGDEISKKYLGLREELAGLLHKYNLMHVELAHLKKQLKQWEKEN
eukprot:TRINITY_DN31313_c0_g1_i2.p1 TRINITY_DN31313_c0_g1~~TRINITY_DN31313_c0_g1_i2.p1  ORF type:complete len:385 (-),score=96.46 TRINITY_DN31313_c0_g1_i2:308-1390(-)